MQCLHKFFVQDIKEGCMITVLADGDPHGCTFSIVSAIKVIKRK